MPAAVPALIAGWRGTLPGRWRGLVVPYGQALGTFVASYAGATVLLRPWALGHWWSFWVPVALGFGVCWWLWRPWTLLARNSKGETRRVPLLFVWILLVAVGWNLRDYLRYRISEVRDLRTTRELVQPGSAVFFRLHGLCYVDKSHLGRYQATWATVEKGGYTTFTAACYYACPLLATPTDTTRALAPNSLAPPLAWLTYTYQTNLGTNLLPGERSWRYVNFVARSNAQFDSLNLAGATYLLREDAPLAGQYRAVRASRLAPYIGSPLLLRPVWAPFAERGARTGRRLLGVLTGGSVFILFLLLVMPLRSNRDLLFQ